MFLVISIGPFVEAKSDKNKPKKEQKNSPAPSSPTPDKLPLQAVTKTSSPGPSKSNPNTDIPIDDLLNQPLSPKVLNKELVGELREILDIIKETMGMSILVCPSKYSNDLNLDINQQVVLLRLSILDTRNLTNKKFLTLFCEDNNLGFAIIHDRITIGRVEDVVEWQFNQGIDCQVIEEVPFTFFTRDFAEKKSFEYSVR